MPPLEEFSRECGDTRPRWEGRVLGALLVLGGAALVLALFSHKPEEVGWSLLNDWGKRGLAGPVEGCSNYLGAVGLYAASLFYFLFGGGAWLLAALLIRIGCRRFACPQSSPRTLWISAGGMMIFACMALSVQEWALTEWSKYMQIYTAGGCLGNLFGPVLFVMLTNRAVSLAIALTGYSVSLIYFVGTTPLGAARGLARELRRWRAARHERRRTKTERRKRELAHAWENIASQQEGERTSAGFQILQNPPPEQKQTRPAAKGRSENRKSGARRTGDPLEELLNPIEEAIMKGETDTPAASAAKGKTGPRIIDGQQTRKPPSPVSAPPFAEPEEKENGAADYEFPPIELLHSEENAGRLSEEDKTRLQNTQSTIIETLSSFGVEVTAGDITRGPTITRYEVYPAKGLRVNRITAVEKDIARATKAERINILAPIPGKDTVGIEIANKNKVMVTLRELLEDPAFRSPKKKIPVALGKDVYGNTVIGDLAAMPHLLVAGTTGSGKSVCINSMIASMLYRFRPDELKLILVDPKVVEMQPYRSLPHLIVPVVTDPRKVIGALRWAVNEMEKRYSMFAQVGVRNFESFNNRPPDKPQPPQEEDTPPDYEKADRIARELESQGEDPEPAEDGEEPLNEPPPDADDLPDRIPYLVIIIDELADLMMMVKEDLETYIARLTQKARAAGIHLIVATQTPRSDVVTGMIKANIPSRIAFQVSSALDSRIILDSPGAEKLVGKGDLLYLPPGLSKLERAQGAFISDEEVEALVAHCARQAAQDFQEDVQQAVEDESGGAASGSLSAEDAELLQKCIEAVILERKASTSFLQRRLRIGYGRAARMLELMEQRGIVSPADGANRPREVLVD